MLTELKMLKSFTLGSIDFGKRFIEVNKESLINIFDDSEEALFGQVKSSIAPDLRKKPSAFEQSVRALLNSPILKLLLSWNPVAWVVEGMTEGLADEFSDFELPDLQPLMHALGDGFQNMGEIGIKTFFRIADALGSALLDIASDPSRAVSVFLDMLKDLFREIFGTVRDLTLGAYDVLVRAIDCVPAILTGKWVIPDLTDMYEEMTEQEFSLLNYATFALAALLEFMAVSAGATQSLGAKLSLPEKWSESLPLEPLYTPVREAMDQMAIQARYPGPSLPEHTQPMVMMITKAGRDTPQAGPAEAEKVKIETTKGKNNYEVRYL